MIHIVLPGGVDDPAAPSGGNTYDRRLCDGLAAAGWPVREHAMPGAWPRPAAGDRERLAAVLAAVPDGATVLLDGLVACPVPEVVEPASDRLRLVVLVHLPLADETGQAPFDLDVLHTAERRSLHAAAAVIATSDWAARRLVTQHGLPADRVHVAAPGVDRAPLAPGTDGASRLLCVASVTPRKGQHLLVEALAELADRRWRCVCAGGLDRTPGYVDRVRALVREHRLADRFRLVGPLTGDDLAGTYATADLVVLPSYVETYGMVVTEALARGIPVVATCVGGVQEALGRNPGGDRPGILVLSVDPGSLARGLRSWFDHPDNRDRLRYAARTRRDTLPGWDATVRAVAGVLEPR